MIMRRPRWLVMLVVTLLSMELATAGCCCTRSALHPDYAGVPDETVRSRDFGLPLDDLSRQSLVDYLVNNESVKNDPGSQLITQRRYDPILSALADSTLTFDLLASEKGAFRHAARATWRMRTNDARSRIELDATNSFAVIGEGFIWCVYQSHIDGTTGVALVVFPKQFAFTAPASSP